MYGPVPYMSYMDDVVPVRVAPVPGMSPQWADRPWSQATSSREGRLSPHAILPEEEELPTYDEVMQNENRYCPIPHRTAVGAPGFPDDSSSTSDSDSIPEGVSCPRSSSRQEF